jgi:hypothetical protein
MRGRFPDRELPGPVSAVEWQTLLSLNRAYLDLRQEWEAACAATASLYVPADGIDGYSESEPYRHHVAAIDAVAALAYDHQRRIGEVTWRYTSAAVVLGAAVMDRLLTGAPALNPVLVEHLAGQEACLRDLQEACDGPYERLITERDDDPYGTDAQARQDLLAGLKGAYYNVTHTMVDGRYPSESEAGDMQLVAASEEDTDPLWEDLLAPVVQYAESLPFHIAHWVRRHSAPDTDIRKGSPRPGVQRAEMAGPAGRPRDRAALP